MEEAAIEAFDSPLFYEVVVSSHRLVSVLLPLAMLLTSILLMQTPAQSLASSPLMVLVTARIWDAPLPPHAVVVAALVSVLS